MKSWELTTDVAILLGQCEAYVDAIGTVIFPWLQPIGSGWDNRNITKLQCKLPGTVTLISAIHQ